ncbi:MAG: hypothetical protein C9356_18595 [Oleiphilus sp.]|nr:MAG: hypothetical protein C9356_18595 [Oleiphilus sp.]
MHLLARICLYSFLFLPFAANAQFDYRLYHGNFNQLPDFSALTPVETGLSNQISTSVSDQSDYYALVFTKDIQVDVAQTYYFQTNSDDGSKLYIDDILVVNNDGLHAPVLVEGSIDLSPGTYALKVEFFEKTGGAVLDVAYRAEGNGYAPIPANGVLNGIVPGKADVGEWGPVIQWPHIAISAANLPDGRVLSWSSTEVNAFPSNREYTHATVFDPTTATFQTVDSNFHDMFCAGISILEDGVIVASGGNPDDSRTSSFDPETMTWSPLSDMNDRRWYGTNLTLPNNQIFSTWAKTANNRSEIYDPLTDTWNRSLNTDMQTLVNEQNAINSAPNLSGALNSEWWAHMAVTPQGKVFQGGPTLTFHNFDPVGGGETEVLGQMIGDRARMYGNAVTYDVGKVLLVGGADRRRANPTSVDDVYLVDLNGPTPAITQGAPMNYPRALSNTVTLPSGEVLVVGGNTVAKIFSDEGSVLNAELYDPQSDTWSIVDALDVPRNYHSTALLLKDGRVLAAGGGACGGCSANHLDGQIFSPPYLFNPDGSVATRPELLNVPAQAHAAQEIIVTSGNDTTNFSMVRLSGTTHHLNTDQRYIPVDSIDNGDGTYRLSLNPNPNVLIPGNYFLFAVNANGTPSIAQTIQIVRSADPFADDDGDGVINSEDAFPNDPTESQDTDGDGVGDNADAFPNDASETLDSDGDGIGDNADPTPFGEGYQYYKFTPAKLRDDPAANSVQLSELSFYSFGVRLANALVTNPNGSNPSNETPDLANDGNTGTKWLDFNKGALVYDFGQTVNVEAYAFTTANDVTARDPVRWTLEASQDGMSWVMLDDRSGEDFPTPVARFTETEQLVVQTAAPPAVTPLPHMPRHSSTIIVESSSGSDRIWNVNPDNDSVSVIDPAGTLLAEISVGSNPWSLAKAPNADLIYVSNKKDASISIISTQSLTLAQTVNLPRASQPHGIVFSSDGADYFVVLEALAQVQKRNTSDNSLLATVQLAGKPRHVSMQYDDSRLLISNFITPPVPGESTATVDVANGAGEVFVIDPASMALSDIVGLSHDDRGISESQGPGLPNYLHAPVISFDDRYAYVPSKKDNIRSGALRGVAGMTFESTVRANASRILLDTGLEDTGFRVDFDNASLATGAALTGDNRYLLTALETSRELSVYDTLNNYELMRLPTGRAPQGVALSTDGAIAYVHNFMDRSVSQFDLSEMIETALPNTEVLGEYAIVTAEALSDQILKGKQLFYDAADDRLSLDNYMSCASCHNEGDSDGRVWDLSMMGEGLRNTISLRGKGAGHGRAHWTGNFDEVQDFENQIRFLNIGSGLMDQADFDLTSDTLGTPKAGFSPDLDALAAYVNSLTEVPPSPFRVSAATMSSEALTGEQLFFSHGCDSCHAVPNLTDSEANLLHDVGTIDADSGTRLGAPLTGFDTPSLLGVWESPPYLHDGSAQTLEDAILAHASLTLQASEVSALVALLSELEAAPKNTAPALQVQTGRMEILQSGADQWHRVDFEAPFDVSPVVVMGPLTLNGGDPTVMRVRNVTETGFEFQMDEWDYKDGWHTTETVQFIAMEPGQHEIDGLKVEAGMMNVNQSWQTVGFSQAFAQVPVVFSQVSSVNESDAVTTRLRNIGVNSFQVQLEEEEASNQSHAHEDVHFIAIEPGSAELDGRQILVGTTGRAVRHSWYTVNFGALGSYTALANMQSNYGGDTSNIRARNFDASSFQVQVDEEQSRDSEVNHTTENVGWLILSD